MSALRSSEQGEFHEALERSCLAEEKAVACHEMARWEAVEICTSATDESKQILAKARAAAEGVLAQATSEAKETMAAAYHRIPLTVGPPNPSLVGEEARHATERLLG
jgi:F0F1-type ATP synthase membrane subunit b/b'